MLNGLVLCGGMSTRMGADKGTLIYNEKTWVENVFDKMYPICNQVFVSINHSQSEKYLSIFDKSTLIVDSLNIQGPLAGILSSHQKFTESDWLILPCDMFDFEITYLEKLTKTYNFTQNDCYAFKINSFIDPFPCIFTSTYLKTLTTENQSDWSVQQLIKKSNGKLIEINEPGFTFKNYNKKSDIESV